VLAVAAACLGAASADAIDISPAAPAVTADNARRNGVADRVRASDEPLAQVRGAYDLVVANILAPVLVELADDLVRVLAPEGSLVISGILAERHDHVLAARRMHRRARRLGRGDAAAVTVRPSGGTRADAWPGTP
jgi:ribosomal protein L11 methyltransferase